MSKGIATEKDRGLLLQNLQSLSGEVKQCVKQLQELSMTMASESSEYKRKLSSLFSQKNGTLNSVNARLALSEKNVEALRTEAIAARQLLEASERARAALEQSVRRADQDGSFLQQRHTVQSSPFFPESRSFIKGEVRLQNFQH